MQKRTLKELGIRVYEPRPKLELKKEHAFPILNEIGHKLLHLGGIIAFIPSLIFTTVKGFFVAKKKIREVQMKYERVLDLRKDQKRRLNLN